MPRSTTGRSGDLARNGAYFLGAFGTVLGLLGAGLSATALAARLAPESAASAPEWVYTLGIVVLLALVVGLWPALDWLAGRSPRLAAALLTALGLLVAGLGAAALAYTSWAVAGWLSLGAAPLLLCSGWLVLRGGGTEPLTWQSLRTPGVERAERRLERGVALLGGVLSLTWLVVALTDSLPIGAAVAATLAIGSALWFWQRRR